MVSPQFSLPESYLDPTMLQFLNNLFFILLFILAALGLLCAMRDRLVAVCGLLSCSMHVGSSSLTKD